MLQGLAHTICVYAKKASGGGADNTPAAVNWSNCGEVSVKKRTTWVYSAQQITGISTSITLQVVFSNTGFSFLYYKIQSTSTVPGSNDPPTLGGYSAASHNATITVSNNEYLVFSAVGSTGSTTVTVNNTSDSNATLDTFTATILV
jgi:hypothetical protein